MKGRGTEAFIGFRRRRLDYRKSHMAGILQFGPNEPLIGVAPTSMLVAKSAALLQSRSRYPLARPYTAAKPGLMSRRACEQKTNSDFATSINIRDANRKVAEAAVPG